MRTLLLTPIFWVIGNVVSYAQGTAPIETTSETLNRLIPKIKYQAPNEVKGMADKYNASVSSYNGGFNLDIPLLDLNIPGASAPVSLSYKSGLKVADISSCVGAGWNIQYGASISRELRGASDFDYQDFAAAVGVGSFGMLQQPNQMTGNDVSKVIKSINKVNCNIEFSSLMEPLLTGSTTDEDYLEAMACCNLNDRYDTERDIFTLVLPELTTRFVIINRDYVITESEREIIFNHIPLYEGDYWIVTSDLGNVYKFGGAVENAVDRSRVRVGNNQIRVDYITNWHVIGVGYPSGRYVTYEYNTYRYSSEVFDYTSNASARLIRNLQLDDIAHPIASTGAVQLYNKWVESSNFLSWLFPTIDDTDEFHDEWHSSISSAPDGFDYDVTYPVTISCEFNGLYSEISFVYVQDRLDVASMPRLISISLNSKEVSSGSQKLIGQVGFNYWNEQDRLWLKSLSLIDTEDSSQSEDYQFEYWNRSDFPAYSSKSCDYFGYYNGIFNSNSIPNKDFSGIPFIQGLNADDVLAQFGDRSVNAAMSVSGSLTRIHTPLGLKIQVDYESNDFLWNGRNIQGGGVRVARVTRIDATNQNQVLGNDYYWYTTNPFGNLEQCDQSSGRLMRSPQNAFVTAVSTLGLYGSQTMANSSDFCAIVVITAGDLSGGGNSAAGGCVGYDVVFRSSTLDGRQGYKKSSFYNDPDYYLATEWSGASLFHFYDTYNAYIDCRPYYRVPYGTRKSTNGQLKHESAYRFSNGHFVLEEETNYHYIGLESTNWDGSVLTAFYAGDAWHPDLIASSYPQLGELCGFYTNGYYMDSFLHQRLVEVEKRVYDLEGRFAKFSEAYEHFHGLIARKVNTGIDGHVRTEEWVYVDEVNNQSGPNGCNLNPIRSANIQVPWKHSVEVDGENVLSELYELNSDGLIKSTYRLNEQDPIPCDDANIPSGYELIDRKQFSGGHDVLEQKFTGGPDVTTTYGLGMRVIGNTIGAHSNEVIFKDFENSFSTPDVGIDGAVNENEAHSGERSALVRNLSSGQSFACAVELYQPDVSKEYVASCWIRSVTGYQSGSVKLRMSLFTMVLQNNQLVPSCIYTETRNLDAFQDWTNVSVSLNVADFTGTLNAIYFLVVDVLLEPNANGLLIDDLLVSPVNSTSELSIYDLKGNKIARKRADDKYEFYSYDGFNRLLSVKDHQGNIVKEIQYHYHD